MATPATEFSKWQQRAEIAYGESQFAEAEALWRRAESVLLANGNSLEAARCAVRIGQCLRRQDRSAQARPILESALVVLEDEGSRRDIGHALKSLGIVNRHLGDNETSAHQARAAREIFRDEGDLTLEAVCSTNLGILLRSLGRFSEAEQEHRSALAVHTRRNDIARMANCENSLGSLCRATGRYDEALEHLLKARALFELVDRRRLAAVAVMNIAITLRWLGRSDEALDHYHQALGEFRRLGLPQLVASCELNLAVLERMSGDLDLARAHYESALAYFRRARRPYRAARARHGLGNLAALDGDLPAALRHLRASRRYFASIGHTVRSAECEIDIGDAILHNAPPTASTGRRVLRHWVPAFVELDSVRFQFPNPRNRLLWQDKIGSLRCRILTLAKSLQDTQLIADLVEHALHSGTYTSQSTSEQPGRDLLTDAMTSEGESPGEVVAGAGDDSDGPEGGDVLSGGLTIIAGSGLPMVPSPPLLGPYGRPRLGRYLRSGKTAYLLATW